MGRQAGEKEKFFLNIVKNYLDEDNVYGISAYDFEIIKKLIMAAVPNERPSEFPDFLIENGFIEHFEITSSYENDKNGSKMKKDEAHFNKEYNEELKRHIETKENEQFHFEIYSKCWDLSGHSYKYLIESLKRNVKSHVESMNAYKGNKEIAIFLINYSDDVLRMCRESSDRERPNRINYYRLSCDIDALEILSQYKNIVKYVLFLGNKHIKDEAERGRISYYDVEPLVELIKVDAIDDLISKIGVKYNIYSTVNGRVKYTPIVTGSKIKNND